MPRKASKKVSSSPKIKAKTTPIKSSSSSSSSKKKKDVESIDDELPLDDGSVQMQSSSPPLPSAPALATAPATAPVVASSTSSSSTTAVKTSARKRKRLVIDNNEDDHEDNHEDDDTNIQQEDIAIGDTIIGKVLDADNDTNITITVNSSSSSSSSSDINMKDEVTNDNIIKSIDSNNVKNDNTNNNDSIDNNTNTNTKDSIDIDNTDNSKVDENNKGDIIDKRQKKKQKKDKIKERSSEYKIAQEQQQQQQQQQSKHADNKEYLPHEAKVHEKSAAVSYWDKNEEIVEITQMRGNFWRTMGFSRDRRCLLYPEEALYLIERGVLLVHSDKNSGQRVIFNKFYEEVITHIDLEVYIAFVKLKTLEYVAFRHNEQVRSFTDDRDVYAYMKTNKQSLLDSVVSYDLHLNDHLFSKKGALERKPVGYVIILKGDWTFSARLMISLLDEAKGVPIIFAAVMPSGNVLLEEFTDALDSLNWENIYARPINFEPEESSSEDDDEDDNEETNSLVDTNKNISDKNVSDTSPKNTSDVASASSSNSYKGKNNKRKFDNKEKEQRVEQNITSNSDIINADNNTDADEMIASKRKKGNDTDVDNNNDNTVDNIKTTNDSSSTIVSDNNAGNYDMIQKLTDDGIDAKDIFETLEALAELAS